jgi:hypothetical protein
MESKRFVEKETWRKRLGSLPDESVSRTCHFLEGQPRWSLLQNERRFALLGMRQLI